MISAPLVADDIADGLISAEQMMYATRMTGIGMGSSAVGFLRSFCCCLRQVEKKIYDISVKIVFGI